ncbi:cytokine receptor family member B16 isoform X2 [Triplophysa dalaica]|uniref:cytokine receptor family member B16 isoform X2 n=1 Tax=Triplophysa dalaica TaxID=1582913 RepID=UPI0024E0217E|nr:cytokine receptor family member B16 isoform X2 [Triplophysa dalaica]
MLQGLIRTADSQRKGEKEVMLKLTYLIKSLYLLFMHFNINYSSSPPAHPKISIQSVNMKHILIWSPWQVSCSTVNYTVQFQGEYELHKLNGTWVDAYDCQEISENQCDLTSDLASNSDYYIRVMTKCDNKTIWTRLPLTFNRKNTVLLAPVMTTVIEGDLVQVGFSPILPDMTVYMESWSEGDEQNALIHVIRNYPYHFTIATHRGEKMCFRAEALVEAINKSCSIHTRCISTQTSENFAILVAVSIAVVVVVALAIFLGCSATHFGPYIKQTICQREPLPNVLLDDRPISTSILYIDVSMEHTDTLLVFCPAESQYTGVEEPA